MKLAALLLLLAACGPISPPPPPHFVLVVHNLDTAAAPLRVTWWTASTVTGSLAGIAAAGSDATFDLGSAQPDGVELETTAWTLAWGMPDYGGGTVFEVSYPNAATRSSFPTR